MTLTVIMRIWGVLLAALAVLLLLAGAASAECLVVRPGRLGHPADDPSVGYSAVHLDLATVYPGAWYVYAPAHKDRAPRPAEKSDRQTEERPRS